MANSKAKAQELKNAYVSGIIDGMRGNELPGAMTQPVVQTASVHAFPNEGVMGAINDGDPGHYVHRNGRTVKDPRHNPHNAMPLPGRPKGAKETKPMDSERQRNYHGIMDEYENDRYGTGDMVNLPGQMLIG